MTKAIPTNIARKPWDLDALNETFAALSWTQRIARLYDFFEEREVLVTSSFGTKSALLLYGISEMRPTQPIHFIDTTYHFAETLAYRDQLAQQLDLTIIDVLPNSAENALTREESWWEEHPRMCCAVNKVAPLEPLKALHRVWISGLMAYQTDFRANLRIFEQQGDILKFHPLIDLTEGEFLYYFGLHQLPSHPLEVQGYGSIGCTHCTKPGDGRAGRWAGTGKTECGLHPGYFVKKGKD